MTPPVNSKSQMIQQAREAETEAQKAYNQAGYRENAMAAKAKDGDSNAENALPEANEQKIAAQNKLKEAQSNLARLTGAADPHRKKSYPRLAKAEPKHVPASVRSEGGAVVSTTTREKKLAVDLASAKTPEKKAAVIKKFLSEFTVQSRSKFNGAFMKMVRTSATQEFLHEMDHPVQGEHMINMLKVQVPNQDK